MSTICNMNDRHTIQPYPLRLQRELRAELEAAAKVNGRSLHAEIVQRLESTFMRSGSELSAGTADRALQMIHDLQAMVEGLVREKEQAIGFSILDEIRKMTPEQRKVLEEAIAQEQQKLQP
ncbi:Arc family DNA-binding protein [Chromobacterium violaceum]|uniref:Arc family DNA-binding protein n=1 Tax=Chromobacterium violaceum TaxID=536 RepID=UPI001E56FE0D|nr:Arc family DNA-binding protein [Chromobacterium violaceum]MCD0493884.1 Arc family DNA-binding protein [Chromobacterium violaceum]